MVSKETTRRAAEAIRATTCSRSSESAMARAIDEHASPKPGGGASGSRSAVGEA
jgi:hypothetical protein